MTKDIVSHIIVDKTSYLNYLDENGDVHHVRILRKDLDINNLPEGIIIKKEQVFPKYSSELKIFDPLSCDGLLYFKMLPMYDVGFSSGYKTTFTDEIYTYEKLDKLRIRGIPKYYGCIISNGFIKGFAIDGYILNLEEYVSKNIISQDISDKINSEIDNIVKDLHNHDIVHGDLNPRNIMLDKNNNVFIIDFDSSGDNMLKKGSTGWMRDDYCKDKSDDLYSLQLVQGFMNQQVRSAY